MLVKMLLIHSMLKCDFNVYPCFCYQRGKKKISISVRSVNRGVEVPESSPFYGHFFPNNILFCQNFML